MTQKWDQIANFSPFPLPSYYHGNYLSYIEINVNKRNHVITSHLQKEKFFDRRIEAKSSQESSSPPWLAGVRQKRQRSSNQST